jgi:hypothetical protein
MAEDAVPLDQPSSHSRIIIKTFECPECKRVYRSTPHHHYYAYGWYGKEICGLCLRKFIEQAASQKGHDQQFRAR